VRALVLLPQTVELVYSGLAQEASFDEKATHNRARAADARAAMDVDAPARLQRVMHAVENLGHVRPLRRGAVILDRLTQILDAEREVRVVGLQLTRLGEVDETLDARTYEAL